MGNILEYALRLNDSGFTGPGQRATRVVINLGDAVGRVGRGAGSVNSLGSAFTNLAVKIGAAFTAYKAVEGAFSGFSKAVTLASDLETTATSFKVLLGSGDAAAGMLFRIKALAAETPFEFPELAKAGKSLLAFGESAGEIPNALRRIGDISSGVGSSIGEIAEIYGKARTQGTLFSEDINQLTGRGIPIIRELASVLKQPEAQIKKLAEEGRITFPLLDQAFRNLTSKGGQFFGMMGEQSKTFSGLWSTLADGVNELFLELGKPLNDSLKPLLADAIGLAGTLTPMFQRIGADVGGLVKSMRDFVVEAESGGGIAEALAGQLKSAISTAGEAFMIPIRAIGAAMPGLGLGLLNVLMPSANWLGAKFTQLGLNFGALLNEQIALAVAHIPGMGGIANDIMQVSGSAERGARGAGHSADDIAATFPAAMKAAASEFAGAMADFKKELQNGADAFMGVDRSLTGPAADAARDQFYGGKTQMMGQMPSFGGEGMAKPGEERGGARGTPGLSQALAAAIGGKTETKTQTGATKENTSAVKENTKTISRSLAPVVMGDTRSKIVSKRDGSTLPDGSTKAKGRYMGSAGGGGLDGHFRNQQEAAPWEEMRRKPSQWEHLQSRSWKRNATVATAPNLTPPAAAKATAERQKDVTARVQGQSSGGGGGGLLEEIKRLVSQIEAHTAKLEVVR